MLREYKIAILPGDGIGPEILEQGIKVLNAISNRFNIKFNFEYGLIGGAAIEKTGIPLPNETLEVAKNSDAVFLGAVGHWKYDNIDPQLRPEKALLGIRKALNLFANLRPVTVYDELVSSSTLKEEYVSGVDIMIIRELTGSLYFGEPRGIDSINGEKRGYNTMVYTESEIERIARVAFDVAMKRQKRLCSVDKANVLDTSRLWREVIEKVAKDYPEVELSHMYVDNAAMQLIRYPKQFDVIVTENMFGDILSDEASMLSGSLGMLASASLSNKGPYLYEPIHGSAPDIAGQNIANPIATIMSAAMMLKYSFNLDNKATIIENAVKKALADGYRTADIMSPGKLLLATSEMGSLIASNILTL